MVRPIKIVNWQSAVPAAEFSNACAAIVSQVAGEFAAAWPQASQVQLVPSTGANVGDEAIWCVGNIAGASFLGEHMDQANVPVGLVLVQPSSSSAGGWASTLGHEVMEQIVDPWCVGGMFSTWLGKPAWLALETADPVEDDCYGPLGNLSNFILPAWFIPGASPPFDHMGRLHAPLTMTAGGYQSYYTGSTWAQSYARNHAKLRHPYDRLSRRIRRGR